MCLFFTELSLAARQLHLIQVVTGIVPRTGMLQLNLPLWERGRERGKVKEEKKEHARRKAQYNRNETYRWNGYQEKRARPLMKLATIKWIIKNLLIVRKRLFSIAKAAGNNVNFLWRYIKKNVGGGGAFVYFPEKQLEQQVFLFLFLPMLSTTSTIPRVTDYISEHELNLMVMPGPASSVWTGEDMLSESFTSAYTCQPVTISLLLQ